MGRSYAPLTPNAKLKGRNTAMNIGMRAHDIDCADIPTLAARLKQNNIDTIQLALLKSAQDLNLQPGMFSPGLARHIGKPLLENGIHISVLGCYINPVHPDPTERAVQIARFKEHIQYAKFLGADMIGTETGSINADFSFNPKNHSEENYQDFLSVMRGLVAYAASLGVYVGIEPVSIFTIYSPKRMKRFLDDIGASNVLAIFDPVNLITAENYQNQRELLDEAFDLFGDRIAAVHLKDFIIENGRPVYALPGDGMLDYPYLFRLLRERKPHVSLLLEEVKEKDLARVRENLIQLAQ